MSHSPGGGLPAIFADLEKLLRELEESSSRNRKAPVAENGAVENTTGLENGEK